MYTTLYVRQAVVVYKGKEMKNLLVLMMLAVSLNAVASEEGAGPIVNVYKDGTSNTFFWSKDGGKMYDGQGQWLCGFLKATINQYQKEKTQPKASKPEAPKQYM
jgi:hypothetical protein